MSQNSQVLVVDDDLAMCGFLRTFLGARSYNALTVTNADEAVRRFHAERPAAVLLDVVMPGSMDGLAALAAFKKIRRHADLDLTYRSTPMTTVGFAARYDRTETPSKCR